MKLCHLFGALPPTIKPILGEDDRLIAVDGGYKYLKKWDLSPDYTVGDFDSLGYVPKVEGVHSLPCQKDETDMEYAIKLGKSQGYQRFLCQGVLGGRLSHTMGNIQLLSGLGHMGGIFLGDGQGACLVQNHKLTFPPTFQGYLSIFALGQDATGVDLENLAYSGKHYHLTPNVPLGVSNQFLLGKSAEISVKEGTLLVIWEEEAQWQDYLFLLEQ